MKKLALALVLLVGLNTTVFGFATILTTIKGGDQISFTSNVSDADVYLDGVLVGKSFNSMFQYKLNRTGKPRVFIFKKKGYRDFTVAVNAQFDNAFWGNLLIGGPLGSSTDSWFTNNTYQYSPNQFYVELLPVK